MKITKYMTNNNKTQPVAASRNAPRDITPEDADRLFIAVMNLRRAWIAPHKYNQRNAEIALVDIHHEIDMRLNESKSEVRI